MKTRLIQIDPGNPQVEEIKMTAAVLRDGGLVVIPTETVYGIAANMLNKNTLERLYQVKQRGLDKPFSVHISDKSEVEKYSAEITPAAYRLMANFWPGPLTLLFKAKDNSKVGLRLPRHKIGLAIIRESGVPIVCPSANLSGKRPPLTCAEALEDLSGLVDLAVDCGKTELGRESTVVDLTSTPIQVLRQGALPQEEIEKIANTKTVLFVCTGNSCRSVMAEGLLRKNLEERKRKDLKVMSAGIILFSGMGPTQETLELLKEEGIDLSGHRSEYLSLEMINQSDLILVMEKLHEKRVLELSPQAKNRVFLLKEFAKINSGQSPDIPDPLGKTKEFYAQTFYLLKQAVERLIDLI